MATRWDRVPKLDDDVVKSTMEDARKVGKSTSNLRGAAVDAVKEAGSRAASRLVGRAGLAGAALQGGYDAGRAIDESTGLGKAMVNKSGLGDLAEEMATPSEKVTLTKNAEERIAKGALNKKPVKRSVSRTTVKTEPTSKPESDYEGDEGYTTLNMKKGGMTASSRADGIAQRGKTRGTLVMCGGGMSRGKK